MQRLQEADQLKSELVASDAATTVATSVDGALSASGHPDGTVEVDVEAGLRIGIGPGGAAGPGQPRRQRAEVRHTGDPDPRAGALRRPGRNDRREQQPGTPGPRPPARAHLRAVRPGRPVEHARDRRCRPGLHIVRRAVAAAQGRVSVACAGGETTFTVWLPAADTAATTAADTATGIAPTASRPRRR